LGANSSHFQAQALHPFGLFSFLGGGSFVNDVDCTVKKQGSYRSGKTGKFQGIWVVREMSGKNIIFEKSGKSQGK